MIDSFRISFLLIICLTFLSCSQNTGLKCDNEIQTAFLSSIRENPANAIFYLHSWDHNYVKDVFVNEKRISPEASTDSQGYVEFLYKFKLLDKPSELKIISGKEIHCITLNNDFRQATIGYNDLQKKFTLFLTNEPLGFE